MARSRSDLGRGHVVAAKGGSEKRETGSGMILNCRHLRICNREETALVCGVRERLITHEDFTLASAPAASNDFTTSSRPLWAAIIKGVQTEPIDCSCVGSLKNHDSPDTCVWCDADSDEVLNKRIALTW